jgi:ribosomal protein L29
MKVNDKKELHEKNPGELRKMLKDGHELLLALKLDREQNKLKNTRGIYNTRKNIAIIKSILKGKEEQKTEGKEETPAAAGQPAVTAEAASVKAEKPAEKAEKKPAKKPAAKKSAEAK